MISRSITRPVAAAQLTPRGANWPWGRLRLQLSGAIVVALLIPTLLWLNLYNDAELNEPAIQTIAGSLLAILLGCWQFRTMSQFPGVAGSFSIASSFSLSFALVIAMFFVTRFEYIRPLFLSAYILSIVWFFAAYMLSQRQRQLIVGVVPFGDMARFGDIAGISWSPLNLSESGRAHVDVIVADFTVDLPDEWERAIAEWSLTGTPVFARKHLLESLTGQVEIEHLSENQFGTLIPASSYLKAKVFLDWIVALCALPILLPFMAVVALAIRADSRGPALFIQWRMGYRRRPFKVFKFRTMARGSGDGSGRDSAITRDGDVRVTRLGRFLRKTRIDELPQIFNILRGEMSWIGPRPEAILLADWYEAELPFYRYRHIVRPGITGWAQVNQGHVADVEAVRTKLNYDFYYIKYFSPWLDMLIVARTARTMLTGFGSR